MTNTKAMARCLIEYNFFHNFIKSMIKAIAFLQSALCISIMLLSGFNAKAQINPIKFEEYDLPNGLHVILHKDTKKYLHLCNLTAGVSLSNA